ncbi:MFS transporter [Saccharothrix violaceirubra]|uniref:MFS family permease n=1 Tax=Saccharothrix violaceirubra TaxID=413306 RepID=A0A7W7SXV8_9PSEU|nr:MFS transporter [Saccharothrix violaceirubra]MBB4962983.1 MFS family permease [Saccharothrix violaceirubra]
MTTPAVDRLSGRDWRLLLVLCGAIFLEGVDISMTAVALPAIREDLDLAPTALQWVVSAYVLGYGGFMLLGGRAADRFGRRRVFLFWLAVFVVFSGLGGFAQDGVVLVVARFVTGLSAAFLTPTGLSIITTTFTGPRRDRALIVYGATGAAGFSLGMVVGGLLTGFGWRWVFFAPVVLAALILVVAIKALPRAERRTPGRFDVVGAVIVTAAMVLLVYGVAEGPSLTAVLGGLVLLGVFAVVERRVPDPLVRFATLRAKASVDIAALLYAASFFGFQFILVLFLQDELGWTPWQTGLALLIMGIDAVLAPTLTPRLVRRFGLTRVTVAGLASGTLAYALVLRADTDWTYWDVLPSAVLVGIAFALAYGPLTIAATDGVPDAEQGLAGGLLNTAFQFGAALGVAGVTAVSAFGTTRLDGYRLAVLLSIGAAVAAAVLVATGGTGRRTAGPR